MWIIWTNKQNQKKSDYQHQEIRENLNNEKTASLTKAFCTALDAHRKKSFNTTAQENTDWWNTAFLVKFCRWYRAVEG